MPAGFEFRYQLRSAIATRAADRQDGPDPGRVDAAEAEDGRTIVLRSDAGGGLVIEPVRADVDPHAPAVVDRARQHARDEEIPRFAAANPTDAFLFRRDADDELARTHLDLRERSVESVADRLLDAASGADAPPDSPTDDAFAGRIRSAHAALVPRYESLIGDAFDRDEAFRESLEAWAAANERSQEYPGVEETFAAVARRHAYQRLSRIAICEILGGRRTDAGAESALDSIADNSLDAVDEYRRECYEAIAAEFDRAELFAEEGIFAAIPESDDTRRRLRDFARSLARASLGGVGVDVVGRLYERVVFGDEPRTRGQFYTPDAIGRLLAGWAIRSPDDRVLDPCCGTGSLTDAAYDRLAAAGDLSPSEIVERITAVDVEAVPLGLAALSLAARDANRPSRGPDVRHEDFFDLRPENAESQGDSSPRSVTPHEDPEEQSSSSPVSQVQQDASDELAIGRFDATIANPPYVRHETLDRDLEHYRDHLRAFAPPSEQPYFDGERALDGRSDLYCYFLTHATRFLRDGGRLAWIVPTKWLTADYGPSLQRFLFDHYRVEAVVGFDERVFRDAQVDTVVVLLERCDDAEERRRTVTEFIRVDESLTAGELLDVVDREPDLPDGVTVTIRGRSDHRTVAVRQSRLREQLGEKLHRYLSGPALYTAIREHGATVPLGAVADVSRGVKTGANPIFVLDPDDERASAVEDRFRRPAIKSAKEVAGHEHDAADAERWLLDLHEYVEAVRSTADHGRSGPDDFETRVLDRLRADGYDGVLSYLRWAENHPSRTNSSIESNRPWFNLGALSADGARIACPQAMDTRRFFFRIGERIIPSNRFLLVRPDADAAVLLGLLNATVTKIAVESHGRITGGGAVNLSATDLRSLRIVDPAALSAERADRIATGFERLASGDDAGLDEIDAAVIDLLGLDLSVDELRTVDEALQRARRSDGGDDGPLVGELDGRFELSFEGGSGR